LNVSGLGAVSRPSVLRALRSVAGGAVMRIILALGVCLPTVGCLGLNAGSDNGNVSGVCPECGRVIDSS
jgi:hypothetical protein